jgi:hypothetical protein
LTDGDEDIEEIATEGVRAAHAVAEPPLLDVDAAIANYRTILQFESTVRLAMGNNIDDGALARFAESRRAEFARVIAAMEIEARDAELREPARRLADIPLPRFDNPGLDVARALQSAREMAAFLAAIHRNASPEQVARNADRLHEVQNRLNDALAALAAALNSQVLDRANP